MTHPAGQLTGVDKQFIRLKLIDQLLRHAVPTLIAGQGVALLAYWALRSGSQNVFMDGWIIVFTMISIGRFISLTINRRNFSPGNIKVIARDYQIGAFAGGLVWASLIVSFDSASPLFSQLFLLVTLVGMPAASLASNAIYLPVFLAFSCPVFLALIFWSLFFSPGHQLEFSLMASVYAALIVYVANQYYSSFKNTIRQEQENQILVREIKTANMKLLNLAYKDPLTNLSNRRQFEENSELLMQQLGTISTSLVLMLVDLDNFKTVNDSLGHEAGDQLLKEVSNRIKSSSRESELVAQSHAGAARIGGDEFVIMYHLDFAEADIHGLARRILRDISEPFALVEDTMFSPSVSIGIALAPQHASTIKELLRVADSAMYRAKEAGGNQFSIADSDDQIRRNVIKTERKDGGPARGQIASAREEV